MIQRSSALCVIAAVSVWGGCDHGLNEPPVAVNDTATVSPGGSVLVAVLDNDGDPDGDRLTLGDVGRPSFGTAAAEGDEVRYTAAEDYAGIDTFTYEVNDGRGGRGTASVTVTVGIVDPDNHPPVAVADAVEGFENTVVDTGNVLANDRDDDGDTLHVESYTEPEQGTLTSNGDGSFDYTPPDDWNGVSSFDYTVSDGRGGTASATVRITIRPHGLDLYVALGGDDEGEGTVDEPLATLEGARARVRSFREADEIPDGGVTVWLRGGIYHREATFELTAEDSGTAARPVAFAAYPEESVRIVGGVALEPSEFVGVTAESAAAVWHRVDPAAHDHLLQLDLLPTTDDFGELTDRGFGYWSGGPAPLELFVDGRPMQLARWPDEGEESPWAAVLSAVGERTYTYGGTRPERWTEAEDPWAHGYWRHMWADKHARIESIDTSAGTITLAEVPGYGLDDGQPWYAENLLEEITEPGEWYLDRSTGTLYLWPPEGDFAAAELFVSIIEEPLVRVRDGSHITFRDITFEMGRAELVSIDGGDHVALEGCLLRNAGLEGALVSGEDNGLEGCEITETGNGGVRLTGGERSSLTRGRNYVRSCHIHHYSRWSWTYTPAVVVSDVGHFVSHNHIHDAPHSAVIFSGNEHFIEYNDIHDVCRWASDAGAIYSGRDWGYRGNRVQWNFVHHVDSEFEGYGVHGVYLDDCVSGIRVFGNVLYRISGNAIQHGGGRDDLMENNVIARCGTALAADSRGVTWIHHDGSDWDLLQKIIDVGYQSPLWAPAYPELAAIPSSWAAVSAPEARWLYPEGSVFSRNICFDNAEHMTTWDPGGGLTSFETYADISDNLEDEDPLFVDEDSLDLTLSPDSPAFDIPDFVAIPFHEIGVEL